MPRVARRDDGDHGPNAGRQVRVNAYEMIKDAIVAGQIDPGEPVVESALADWCGVSRTPIREALRRLEHDGLLAWSERGLVVRRRSPQEILDIYEMRIQLEATAARFACERRTGHDVAMLRAAVDHCRTVDETDASLRLRANHRFHQLTWQAAHNEALRDLLDRLATHLVQRPGITLSVPGQWQVSCTEHEQIFRAVEQRDTAEAARLTEQHFTEARDTRLRLFASQFPS